MDNHEIEKKQRDEFYYNLFDTGDLIFFNGNGWVSWFISFMSGSCYSHMSMVLKDPVYIDIKLKGLYLIESNFPIDKASSYYEHPLLLPEIVNKNIINGVQIIPFEDVFKRNQDVYYRKLICKRDNKFKEKINEIHKEIHHLPYDIELKDWLSAETNVIIQRLNLHLPKSHTISLIEKNRTDRFWCSALIGYIYMALGFLDESVNWSLLSPENFSKGKVELSFINCELGPDKKLNNLSQ